MEKGCMFAAAKNGYGISELRLKRVVFLVKGIG